MEHVAGFSGCGTEFLEQRTVFGQFYSFTLLKGPSDYRGEGSHIGAEWEPPHSPLQETQTVTPHPCYTRVAGRLGELGKSSDFHKPVIEFVGS